MKIDVISVELYKECLWLSDISVRKMCSAGDKKTGLKAESTFSKSKLSTIREWTQILNYFVWPLQKDWA
jgi:hypothetical protein